MTQSIEQPTDTSSPSLDSRRYRRVSGRLLEWLGKEKFTIGAGTTLLALAGYALYHTEHKPVSFDQRYETAAVHAFEHPRTEHPGTFKVGDKIFTFERYAGNLTFFSHTSVFSTPTDTSVGTGILSNLDSAITFGGKTPTFENGLVVNDAINHEGGLWIGAPQPNGTWDWAQLSPVSADFSKIVPADTGSLTAPHFVLG